MNVGVPATDTRRIEVLAQDLPCFAGAQLAVDITLRSALTSNGEAQPQAEHTECSLVRSKARQGTVLPGWHDPGAPNSWWSASKLEGETTRLCARVRDVPCHLSQPAELAWERRWTRMLSTVCAVSSASLVEPVGQCDLACWTGGEPPTLSDCLRRTRGHRTVLT